MKTADFPAVQEARRAATGHMRYYSEMMQENMDPYTGVAKDFGKRPVEPKNSLPEAFPGSKLLTLKSNLSVEEWKTGIMEYIDRPFQAEVEELLDMLVKV